MKPLGARRAGADRYFFLLCLSPRRRLEQTRDLRVELPGDRESGLTPVGSDAARHRVVGQCTPSARSSTRLVSGAYEAASGTVCALSCMRSGVPTTRRRICSPCPPRAFCKTSPASHRTHAISSADPIAPCTTASRSATGKPRHNYRYPTFKECGFARRFSTP
jgi:hypothetical protein